MKSTQNDSSTQVGVAAQTGGPAQVDAPLLRLGLRYLVNSSGEPALVFFAGAAKQGVEGGLKLEAGMVRRTAGLPFGDRARADAKVFGEGADAQAQRAAQNPRLTRLRSCSRSTRSASMGECPRWRTGRP
jgi:hypothetical protein